MNCTSGLQYRPYLIPPTLGLLPTRCLGCWTEAGLVGRVHAGAVEIPSETSRLLYSPVCYSHKPQHLQLPGMSLTLAYPGGVWIHICKVNLRAVLLHNCACLTCVPGLQTKVSSSVWSVSGSVGWLGSSKPSSSSSSSSYTKADWGTW